MTSSSQPKFISDFRCALRPALALLLAVPMLLNLGCRHSSSLSSTPAPQIQSLATPNPAKSDSELPGATLHTEIGFASRQKFLDHYDKHGAEFGSISKEEYLHQAQVLRDRPAGGDILEVTRADGVITRFDRKTGAFLAFNSNLTIRTYFKPNDGENYFRRQSKRSTGRDSNE